MIDLTIYGYRETMRQNDNPDLIPARVTATHKERYELVCTHGEIGARLKSSVYYNNQSELTNDYPTTGDFVIIKYNPIGESQILQTLERKSVFERLDPYVNNPKAQAVAANVDYVFILTSLNHDLNFKRLERYLATAWQSGAVPVVVLTKMDLTENYSEKLREVEKFAKNVSVFACSALTGEGFSELSDYLKPGKTIVLLGSSGVGKSSFINVLAGEELMKVNSIREDDSKGRHTTTHRQLIMLKSGVMIIDTPGMRVLGMWNCDDGVSEVFDIIEELTLKCKFSNCTHTNETGCAVKGAIRTGTMSNERLENYRKLKREARFHEKKEFIKQKEARNAELDKNKYSRKNDLLYYDE